MVFSFSRLFRLLIILPILIFLACASVPKEIVELSYMVGQDLSAVHTSYMTLIRTHYAGLRNQAINILETRLIPTFLEDFIESGELIKMAQGDDPKIVLEDVKDWVDMAMEQKKRELIDPINSDEEELIKLVDEAFSRLIRANATITAHLNSIRKVQQVQDEALKAMNIKELRDKINEGLISSSKKTKEAINKLKKAEDTIR